MDKYNPKDQQTIEKVKGGKYFLATDVKSTFNRLGKVIAKLISTHREQDKILKEFIAGVSKNERKNK